MKKKALTLRKKSIWAPVVYMSVLLAKEQRCVNKVNCFLRASKTLWLLGAPTPTASKRATGGRPPCANGIQTWTPFIPEIRKFRLKGVVTQIEPYGEIYQTIGQCILCNCNPAANKQYVNKARGEQTCLYKLCQAVS